HTSENNFRWSGGIDVIASTPRYRNVFVQQIFIEAGYKALNIRIGSKENYTSLWDRELSSGDMVISRNARPVPEIDISVPRFTEAPFTNGLLQYKGNFALGRSFDNAYLTDFTKGKEYFTKDILWHHKSFYIRISDQKSDFPLTVILGVRHYAQWAGVSDNPGIGVQPHSLKDFLRVIAGHAGGEDATMSDQINVLGNHFGSYDMKIGYLTKPVDFYLYKQHYFDDVSGMELYNFPDGLYGFQADIKDFSFVNKIVVEYLSTLNQSGPFHYISYDHDVYPGYGGGADNYYNNGSEYPTGASYYNRAIGSPLLTSPMYNENGKLSFRNNRVKAFHFGISGYLSNQFSYRLLATYTDNRGTMETPFLDKKKTNMFFSKFSYCHPRLEGWLFGCELAADFGTLYTNNQGISFSISKTGILKK
ncbi:MAG: capsule assembly Wzi family protein, partial [Tannerella sp.]|nr:capsule assembly Wzi family protein [Tannerella sp.]